MSVANTVIIPYDGTNASIPSGWSRVTSLDGKFPKAWGTQNPNLTGGSNSHSHSSTHTHTLVNHSHSGNTSRDGAYESDGGDTANSAARDAHIHSFTTTATQGGSLSGSVTYQTSTWLPPYYEVIFIKPSGNVGVISQSMLVGYTNTDSPSGWAKCDGTGGTPDLTNKYLRGAGTGANAGGTGGTSTHTHTIDHTHSATTHTHTGESGGNSDGGRSSNSGTAGGAVVLNNHTHLITLNANSGETGSAYTGTAGSADSVDLEYKKIKYLKNITAGGFLPIGSIAMTFETTAPKNWSLCDGTNGTPDLRNKYLKITNTDGELNSTGGSNAHTHAASNSHTHTASGAHSHTSGSSDWEYVARSTGAGADGASKDHNHPSVENVTTNTSVWNSSTISADSSSNEPEYRTVAYIQKIKNDIGGAFIMSLLMRR